MQIRAARLGGSVFVSLSTVFVSFALEVCIVSRTAWILVAAGLVLLYLWRKASVVTGAAVTGGLSPQDQATLNTINVLAAPSAGFYAGASTLTPAYTGNGWNPYPGWFRTDDGGWVNPSTGETYSVGSSPPALAEPVAQSSPLYIDLTPTVTPTVDTNDPYLANQIIY